MTCSAGLKAQTGPMMSHCAGPNHRLTIPSGVIKDPADLIEKPLHMLGLHGVSAIAVAAAIALMLGLVVTQLWRRRITPS